MTEKKSKKPEEKKTENQAEANREPEETRTDSPENGADELEEAKKALDDANKELAAQKDKYIRLAAEYDNYRKRTAGEKLSIYDNATAKACTELLPVADSVTMALANLKDADPEILKGIELISSQLEKSFEKLKIESYGKEGDEFDPNLHNAVSRVENEDLGKNTIAAVYQAGYKIGDKVIRHAMVQVANCD